jgi:hypothetical protein
MKTLSISTLNNPGVHVRTFDEMTSPSYGEAYFSSEAKFLKYVKEFFMTDEVETEGEDA